MASPISPAVKIYRVADNRRTVTTSTTPHMSDQLGTENACKTLLCWFIVMIRVLVCSNMYQYQHHFGSFHRNPRRFRFIAGKWVNTGFFFLIQRQGVILLPTYFCKGRMWKSNIKNIFHIISHVGLSECLCQTTWYWSFHLPAYHAHSRQSERQNIIDRTHTWQQCLAAISEGV